MVGNNTGWSSTKRSREFPTKLADTLLMNKNQARLLRHAICFSGSCGAWLPYQSDCIRTLNSLWRHGLIEINRETKQFRLMTRGD